LPARALVALLACVAWLRSECALKKPAAATSAASAIGHVGVRLVCP
jgi:hypothetical protein